MISHNTLFYALATSYPDHHGRLIDLHKAFDRLSAEDNQQYYRQCLPIDDWTADDIAESARYYTHTNRTVRS